LIREHIDVEVRGERKEERGKRKEERGKRKEERGKRKEERGKRKEERGKTAKLGPWTMEDVRMLKTLAREKTRTIVIARKLKRTAGSDVRQGNCTWRVSGHSWDEE
jgi:hypothetical protein